jgi:type IV secretory pathway TrbD component
MPAPGFRIKLHQSLIAPILFAGVPRKFAILNGTISAALGLGLHLYYILLIGIGLHFLAAFFAKKDPLFFEIILRYLKQRQFYDI